jgi:hypothetical protein
MRAEDGLRYEFDIAVDPVLSPDEKCNSSTVLDDRGLAHGENRECQAT